MAYIEVKTEQKKKSVPDIQFHQSRPITLAGSAGIAVTCVLVGVMAVLALVLPKPEVSELEGRRLASMPELSLRALLSGEYTEQVDAFYSDTFPFRDTLVELAAHYNSLKGFNPDDVSLHGTVPVVPDQPSSGTPSEEEPPQGSASSSQEQQEEDVSSQPESSTPSSSQAEDGIVESDGEMKEGVFVVGDRAMSLFGTNGKEGERYAKVITGYQEQFGSDVTIYNLVVPTQSEFYLPKNYAHLSRSQKENIDMIYSNLGPTIKPIRSAYDELAAHTSEYLYFRTDHHWTPLAAYYAYVGFCKDAGLTAVPLDKMTTARKDSFLGSLYRLTQAPKLKANPDYMDYYMVPVTVTGQLYKKGARNTPLSAPVYAEYAKGANTYSLFLGGDWPLFVIKSNAGTGRSIAVVKESFGNAFAPYLASHYDTVYVIDQRYFEKDFDQFVRDNGIKEVLFINNVFAANTTVHINWIKNLNYEKPWPAPSSSEAASSQPSSSEAQ